MGSSFLTFFQLGFEHILDLEGYDHILFLVALCAIYRLSEWSKVAILVTAFTIGHSITLALAALNILTISSNWIEFLIPVTIVFTALYNIVFFQKQLQANSNRVQYNYLLALLFGLIHGWGFSNFFRAMALPGEEREFIFQLFAFNLGVEGGQLIIISLILLTSFLVLNVLKVKQMYWNWLISGIVGIRALMMAIERSTALF